MIHHIPSKGGQSTEPLQVFYSFIQQSLHEHLLCAQHHAGIPALDNSQPPGLTERRLHWDKEGHRPHHWPRSRGFCTSAPCYRLPSFVGFLQQAGRSFPLPTPTHPNPILPPFLQPVKEIDLNLPIFSPNQAVMQCDRAEE